jgi:hypothetical protein
MAYEPPIDQAKPLQMKTPVAIAMMTRTANVRPFLRTVGTTGNPAKTRVFIASPHPHHAAQFEGFQYARARAYRLTSFSLVHS